jgi:hypothetical protein
MAPRRTKQVRTREVRDVSFRPEHRDLFRLAADDWTAPAKVRVTVSAHRYTFVAKFLRSDGHPFTLTTRCAVRAGGVHILEERLAVHFGVPSVRGR